MMTKARQADIWKQFSSAVPLKSIVIMPMMIAKYVQIIFLLLDLAVDRLT